jgi:hypothetical protein
MFPIFYGASNGGIGVGVSPSQARIVHGSPIYRAGVVAGSQSRGEGSASSEFDPASLFGHRGSPLRAIETTLLAALCGNEREMVQRLPRMMSASERSDLARIAADARVAKPIRTWAATLSREPAAQDDRRR